MAEIVKQTKPLAVILVVIVLAVLGYLILTAPDNRTTTEKIGDAIHELPDTGKAAKQLEDRTPGEKLGDAVKDVGDDIKNTTDTK